MLEASFFGIFGLLIGSFLNVLTLRWGSRSLTGRSACESCKRQIAWYDLVPVLSWIVLRGRCRSCGKSISLQYPLVELVTGAIFALIGAAPVSLSQQLLALPIAGLLIAIAVYDLHHTIIPDAWVYICAALALCSSLLYEPVSGYSFVLLLLSGPVIAVPLFSFWYFSRGTWMGFGDVKFALLMGWLLGLVNGFQALMLAFILGAVVSILLLLLSRYQLLHRIVGGKGGAGYTMKSEVPFGPFLVAATFIVWLMQMHGTVVDLTAWVDFR
ncbi:hypothetical protein A2853_03625 [Candidatus Kaiserbacteria bacterium RIFCSPHIGHO2_01_FULL_55_17]|uniref:Prepilin peptidase n=1 Tax=Candidatus Kaiserbacteria bacterium RIFCSPHIGHO2_01_FULL_55_17 TaxID=1798484 RepID=A0A1F6D7P2_9BACT|nr:MAG: hypothetical protein A2853_03625 [Candidatus Kaiserbacteria bacterium RIFCSPHIGHO2_01_FULL_55_17]